MQTLLSHMLEQIEGEDVQVPEINVRWAREWIADLNKLLG